AARAEVRNVQTVGLRIEALIVESRGVAGQRGVLDNADLRLDRWLGGRAWLRRVRAGAARHDEDQNEADCQDAPVQDASHAREPTRGPTTLESLPGGRLRRRSS